MRAAGRLPRGVWWWFALASLLTPVVAACGRDDTSAGGLTLFAAASLRTVTDELEAAWMEAYPDEPLTIAAEASNVLTAQIEEGAQADIFISADDVQTGRLAAGGLTASEPVPFARNEVALVARPDGPVTEVADLADPGTSVIVGGPGTPIGRYTVLALEALAAETADPVGFADAVEANIASREDNVRAALARVELGEADAAFVYRTDALGSEDTVAIELPPSARVGAVYSVVLLSEKDAAVRFLEWLRGPEVRDILRGAGFEVMA